VLLNLGDGDTLCLADTGASVSLLRGDVARRVVSRLGRPFTLTRCTLALVTLSGSQLNIEGKIELNVEGVGSVSFVVVKDMKHECILGWDQMRRHGWALDSRNGVMRLGGKLYHVEGGSPFSDEGCLEAAETTMVDAGYLNEVLAKHQGVFGDPSVLPAARLGWAHIKTEPGKVVALRPYRAALNKRHLIDEEIDKMLSLGVIRPSRSEWASPVTLVPKSDGTTRFCVDFRAVNAITVKDRYPLPLIDDIFDQLGGSKQFSTMDLRSGFWQQPVHPDSIAKTAFVCHRGQFEFLRQPFGLANAPSQFSREISNVLGDYIGDFCLCFIDDIVIFSKTPEEHQRHVHKVLERLGQAGLTVKATKCAWAKTSLDLLGYVVSEEGIAAQPGKTRAIENLDRPVDVKGVQDSWG